MSSFDYNDISDDVLTVGTLDEHQCIKAIVQNAINSSHLYQNAVIHTDVTDKYIILSFPDEFTGDDHAGFLTGLVARSYDILKLINKPFAIKNHSNDWSICYYTVFMFEPPEGKQFDKYITELCNMLEICSGLKNARHPEKITLGYLSVKFTDKTKEHMVYSAIYEEMKKRNKLDLLAPYSILGRRNIGEVLETTFSPTLKYVCEFYNKSERCLISMTSPLS